jgi:hypothetical protein
MGIVKDWKITFAQGDLLKEGEEESEEDGEAAEPQEDVGQAQARAIGAAHAAH